MRCSGGRQNTAMGVSPERGGGIHPTRAKGHITVIHAATAAATPAGVPFIISPIPRAAFAFAHLPMATILSPSGLVCSVGVCLSSSVTWHYRLLAQAVILRRWRRYIAPAVQ